MRDVIYTDGTYSLVQLSQYKFELYKNDIRLAMGDWTFVTGIAQQRYGITGSMVARYRYQL